MIDKRLQSPRRTVLPTALTLSSCVALMVLFAGPRVGQCADSPLARSPAEAQVAVAANFALPMRQLAAQFSADTGHRVVTIVGATGKLRAQIENGAPIDVFLAADTKASGQLESEGQGVSGTRFTYAIGKLILWSPRPGYIDAAGAVLKRGDFHHLAVANPRLAPYGAAAIEVLAHLGILEAIRARIVEGEDVAQTQAFIASGNAELGFIAASQRPAATPTSTADSLWVVPADLYSPLRQDALLLRRADHNPAARAFMAYLRGAKARATIRSFGYGVDDSR